MIQILVEIEQQPLELENKAKDATKVPKTKHDNCVRANPSLV